MAMFLEELRRIIENEVDRVKYNLSEVTDEALAGTHLNVTPSLSPGYRTCLYLGHIFVMSHPKFFRVHGCMRVSDRACVFFSNNNNNVQILCNSFEHN